MKKKTRKAFINNLRETRLLMKKRKGALKKTQAEKMVAKMKHQSLTERSLKKKTEDLFLPDIEQNKDGE